MQSLTHTPWHLEPTAGAERIIKMFSSNVHKLWFYRSWDREKRCSLFVNVPNTKVHQEQMVVTTELQPCLFSSAQNVMPTYVWEKAGRIMTETWTVTRLSYRKTFSLAKFLFCVCWLTLRVDSESVWTTLSLSPVVRASAPWYLSSTRQHEQQVMKVFLHVCSVCNYIDNYANMYLFE